MEFSVLFDNLGRSLAHETGESRALQLDLSG